MSLAKFQTKFWSLSAQRESIIFFDMRETNSLIVLPLTNDSQLCSLLRIPKLFDGLLPT